MDQLIKDLHQPSWWVSVVIAGLIVGIVSSYARDLIDRAFGDLIGWNRNRSLSRKQQFEKAVATLAQNPDKRIYYSIKAIELRQRSYLRYLLGFLMGMFGVTLFSSSIWQGGALFLLSCYWLIAATLDLAQADGIRKAVNTAQDEAEEKETTNSPL